MTISSGRSIASSHGPKRVERSSAGSARLPTITGCTNSTETCCASVEYGPRPNASSRPPLQEAIRHRAAGFGQPARLRARKTLRRARLRSSRRSSTLRRQFAFARLACDHSNRFSAMGRPPAYRSLAFLRTAWMTSTVHAGCSRTSPMICAAWPPGVPMQCSERRLGVFGSQHGQELSFVRDVQRVEA